MMIPKSIRWRLPLSYAGIALLATLALGGAMLAILRAYYLERERAFLDSNAQALSEIIVDMERIGAPLSIREQYAQGYSFLAQSRVRVLDENQQVIIDSGSPDTAELPSFAAIGLEAVDLAQFPAELIEESGVAFGFFEVGGELMLSDSITGAQSIALPPLPAVGTPLNFSSESEGEQNGRHSSLIALWPIYDENNEISGYIELSEGPAYGTQILSIVVRGWLIASGIAVLLAAVVGWFASRRITQPLLALNQATMAMSEGTFSVRADADRADELGQLANSFNHMAGYVEETIATLRRFVSDAAHELHTPLTALQTNLELTENESDAAERRDLLEQAQTQVSRLEDLTNNLLALSRIESGMVDKGLTTVNLTTLVQETSELYASHAEQMGVIFALDVGERPVFVQGNDSQLRRAVGNLLDNAIKFTPSQGTVTVVLTEENGQACLSVTDNGIGIPTEELPRLFSRFHRGLNAAAYPGSGLGLAIVKAIVEAHGGKVEGESNGLGQGSKFVISLTLHAS
jgi:signal transduction histidine kinase